MPEQPITYSWLDRRRLKALEPLAEESGLSTSVLFSLYKSMDTIIDKLGMNEDEIEQFLERAGVEVTECVHDVFFEARKDRLYSAGEDDIPTVRIPLAEDRDLAEKLIREQLERETPATFLVCSIDDDWQGTVVELYDGSFSYNDNVDVIQRV